jgi:hypothetical protein
MVAAFRVQPLSVDHLAAFSLNGRLMVCLTRGLCLGIVCLAAGRTLAEAPGSGGLRVVNDFEGASVRVLSVDQDQRVVSVTPGGDPERGWPCWWYFRIEGLTDGQTATVEVKGSPLPARNNGNNTGKPLAANWAMPERATFSNDGVTWKQTKPGASEKGRIRYHVVGTGGPVWVAWGPPFTPNDTDRLIDDACKAFPSAQAFELAKTREGRPVRGLVIANEKRPAVWIQARQHAWESGASWVARGLVEWLVSEDASARDLRSRVELFVVPIMDVDNVATGNGGKEANPRDHNRDWDGRPFYPEVEAAQVRLKQLAAEKRLSFFIDLHNPAAGDKRPFFFAGPPELLSQTGRERREQFIEIAAKRICDPLPLLETPRITGPSYHPLWKQISGQWVNANGNPDSVAICLETSWNTPHSTTDGYRTVGRQLGQSIAQFFAATSE